MEIYQEFNAHFINIETNLAENVIRLQKYNKIPHKDEKRNPFSTFMHLVDVYEIMILFQH